jgi:hypothetical protein
MTVAMLKSFVNRAPADAENLRSAGLVFDALNRPPDQLIHHIIHPVADLNDERTIRPRHASDVRRQVVDRKCRRIAAKRRALDNMQQLSDVSGIDTAPWRSGTRHRRH